MFQLGEYTDLLTTIKMFSIRILGFTDEVCSSASKLKTFSKECIKGHIQSLYNRVANHQIQNSTFIFVGKMYLVAIYCFIFSKLLEKFCP